MSKRNKKRFENPKIEQIFNRYATYNGSDPYRAPALLNLIPHLEFNQGAYFPKRGHAFDCQIAGTSLHRNGGGYPPKHKSRTH